MNPKKVPVPQQNQPPVNVVGFKKANPFVKKSAVPYSKVPAAKVPPQPGINKGNFINVLKAKAAKA